MKFILSGDFALIWNDYTYREAVDIINRLAPDISSKNPNSTAVIAVHGLKRIAKPEYKVTEMPDDWPPVSRDRKDDPFLYAAQEGNAHYIISEDKPHMLVLRSHKGIPIGTPNDFFLWANEYQKQHLG